MHAQRGWKGRGLMAALGMLLGGCSQQSAETTAHRTSPREGAPETHAAPRITSTFQSELRWFSGNRVTFRVVADDPQARALTITWTTNTGTLGPAVSEATQSEVEWTAPPCMLTDTPPEITATVTNAVGLSSSATFSLTGATSCVAEGALSKGSRILSMQSESVAWNAR